MASPVYTKEWLLRLARKNPQVVGRGGWWGFPSGSGGSPQAYPGSGLFPAVDLFPRGL